jgi:hypothetical protein
MLGLESASFKWNQVEEHENEDADAADDITVSDDSRGGRSLSERKFELQDVSIVFPEGVLTVITGPTARLVPKPLRCAPIYLERPSSLCSGKTALLVGFFF